MRQMPLSSLCTRTEDPRDYRVSFARITNQLGYKTTRTVAQGIGEVARLVREGVVGNFAGMLVEIIVTRGLRLIILMQCDVAEHVKAPIARRFCSVPDAIGKHCMTTWESLSSTEAS